jgi:tripartite-type tricarboxylate transporter receptor subunit TctC
MGIAIGWAQAQYPFADARRLVRFAGYIIDKGASEIQRLQARLFTPRYRHIQSAAAQPLDTQLVVLPEIFQEGQMRRFFITSATIAALAFAQGAPAQSFPNKPIRLIEPFAAGGPLDLIARAVGQKVSESIGQPVIIENRAGASGVIASEAVARSAPDGYTLLVGSTTTHGINPALNRNLPYDPVKDFTPISLLATIPHILVVNASLPVNSLQDLVRLAKSKPGMAYGSAGNGSPHHLAGEMFKLMAGIDAVHVPYKGSTPALTDLIGGQFQFMSVELSGAEPYLKAGKLKALAIATAARVPGVDLPTFAESGYPGFEVTAWYAIFGPPGMPENVVSRLSAEIVKAVAAPDVRDRLQKVGATPVGGSPAELGAHVRAELARWTKVVKAAGIKPD